MSSNFPNQFDLFETKVNATSANDPLGDYVMAEDVNDLQDSITAIENVLGLNPQGASTSVSDRISQLEGLRLLRVPPVLFYNGVVDGINGSLNIDEAVTQYLKYDHVILAEGLQMISNSKHGTTISLIQKVREARSVKFYGTLSSGFLGLTLAEIQTMIGQWKAMGVTGIYCGNFGYENGVSRELQNQILNSIHEQNLVAILNAENPDELFSETGDTIYNPDWLPSAAQQGDIYFYDTFAIDSRIGEHSLPLSEIKTKMEKMYTYRTSLGIQIFGSSFLSDTLPTTQATTLFEYVHTVALLFSLDALCVTNENYGAVSNEVNLYYPPAITGNWYSKNPLIKVASPFYSRETVFGKITVNASNESFIVEGASIPSNLIRFIGNSIDGAALMNASIEDIKIASYDGSRLVTSINNAPAEYTFSVSRISGLLDGDGGIDSEFLEANVIQAINANIGKAVIESAVIGDLDASHIKTGTLDANRISASVVSALNIYAATMQAGDAQISNAVIGTLTADHIKAAVIEAINISSENITAEKLKATVVEAINISASDISAERMRANIVTAINIYADQMDVNSARINVATIGELTANHIVAAVIDAINLNADTAKINGAKIGELEARSIEAIVIHAINISTEQALIDSARIGELTADKITAGVIDAINLYAGNAVIGEAKIGNLSAEKITAGNIDANRMTANVVDAVNLKAGIATVGAAIINSAAIGVLGADHIQAAVISAINLSTEHATIHAAKIGVLEAGNIKADSIDASKLTADSVTSEKILAGAIQAVHIEADAITADKIAANAVEADTIKAGAVVAGKIAADAIIAGNIAADVIGTRELKADAVEAENIKAGSVVADKIAAGAVETDKLDAGAVVADKIAAGAIETDKLHAGAVVADKIAADAIETVHIKAGAVDTEALAARSVTAEKIAVGSIVAENIFAGTITSNLIAAGAITSDLVAANAIQTTHISTAGLDAGVIKTGKLDSSVINTDTLTVKHIQAGVITTDNISTGGLDAAVITSGYIDSARIKIGSIDASTIKAGTITSVQIAANAITTNNIQAGAITGDIIQAGSITAQHISAQGIDANIISVFGKAGETLIGDGYLRVDGFDVGVIQSDNLVGNGMFMTASSSFGYLKKNPDGEALLGSGLNTEGAHELWKIDLSTNTVAGKLLIPGKKPSFIGIGKTLGAPTMLDDVGRYAYVTVQGNDTLVQVDLDPNNFSLTGKTLNLGKGPGRIKYTGNKLGDHKHFFVVNSDPTDVNAPDSFIVIDAPPVSDDITGDGVPDLYVHHQIVTGNTPYDFVLTDDKLVYVTLADQGDILILSMTDFPTMYWKAVGSISISPHGMDNYHGGLSTRFGLGYAVGGDAASTTEATAPTGEHNHGGYGSAISDEDKWSPHGIAVSTDQSMLYVTDHDRGELIAIGRITPHMDHSIGGMEDGGGGHSHYSTVRNTPNYGGEIHARIKVGDSPEFIQVANGKIFVTLLGSDSVAVFDESTVMMDTKPRKLIQVGLKPLDMVVNAAGTELLVSINGENRVARINIATETIVGYIDAGANVMGLAIDVGWDGKEYLYLVNNGGTGSLSFVYPEGNYIGDPYLGLEGSVEYQGAEHWAPNRTDWVYEDAEKKNVRDYALVEFRVNEPFLNEGGYARLLVAGKDSQQAEIQQDLYNVVNYSNGNTLDLYARDQLSRGIGSSSHIFFPKMDWADPSDPAYTQMTPVTPEFRVYTGVLVPIIKELLTADTNRKVFTPQYEWVEKPAPVIQFSKDNGVTFEDTNMPSKIYYEDGAKIEFDTSIPVGTKVYAVSYSYRESYICPPELYTVYYNKFANPASSRVEFQQAVVPAEGRVDAKYSYILNSHHKNHNGSVLIAMNESSSKNFSAQFIIEEFVPKFVVMDNLTTGVFTPIEDGVDQEYEAPHYSFTSSDKSVRSRELPVAQISTNGTWVLQDMDPTDERAAEAVDGKYPKNVFTWDFRKNADGAIFRGAHNNSKRYVTVTGSGVKTVTIDLVKTYMVGHCDVWMEWDTKFPLGRTYTYTFWGGVEQRDFVTKTYKNVKIESSEDGVSWFTWLDMPSWNANWFGAHTAIGIEPEVPNGKTNLYASIISKPTRYMRFSTTGWEARDPDTGTVLLDGNGNEIKGDTMDIAHCHAYADWEVEYDYMYPAGSEYEGEQMASNGRSVVTTDIPKAYVSIDIDIEYTSWWYMTYLIGPEFGEALVKMPTVMGGSHSLFYQATYLNKIEHRHTMSMPPGKHRVLIQQNSGKISLDRIRFEDYQYSGRSTVQTLTNTSPSTFTRYKIVADQTRNYIGKGKQSTEGAFDRVYLNPDTQLPDFRVPLKYRFKVRAGLNNPTGSLLPEVERGLIYVTSAIFETGKQSTSWRMSQTSDSFPGSRIEAWNPSFPHKTGIQSFHLANGAVRGPKILPSAIMDYHISPYAKIGEYKLDLNYDTHYHGHFHEDGSFLDNKSILDTVHGWGILDAMKVELPHSGVLERMARADHWHPEYLSVGAGGIITADLTINANLIMGSGFTVDGVDISAHASDTTIHLAPGDRTKLTDIATGAHKVTDPTPGDGVITLTNGAGTTSTITVYTHPTGAGSNHIPAGGASTNVLKWSAAGTAVWSTVGWTEVSDKPTEFTPPIASATVLGGVKIGANISVAADGTISSTATYVHPTGAGYNHIPAGGATGNFLKWSSAGTASWTSVAWGDLTGVPSAFTPTAHNQTVSTITDISTYYARLGAANTLVDTLTLTKAGLGLKIQPSAALTNTVLMQVAKSTGESLFTIDSEGDISVAGNLNVTGTTTYVGSTQVDGDYTISGNLTVQGSTTIGTGDETDIIRVNGELRLLNTLRMMFSFPVYGPGDLPIEVSSTTFDTIIEDYGTFLTGPGRLLEHPSGGERWYVLLVRYNDEPGSTSTLRIVQDGTTTSAVTLTNPTDFDLPNVGKGVGGGARTWTSAPFQSSFTGDTIFQVKRNTAGSAIQIKHIEVIVYDKFTS